LLIERNLSIETVNTHVIIGWIVMLAGTALWVYGYFVTGHPTVVDWKADTPNWIAEFLPNIESEIGMVLVFIAMVPIYWPAKH
jgi:Ni,Fe-hydrogenase I cytochrome b subunit